MDSLEAAGFGKRTGRTARSGFVTYPEFEFDAEVLKAYANKDYEDYLKWQDVLKEDEEYMAAGRRICSHVLSVFCGESSAWESLYLLLVTFLGKTRNPGL